MKKVFILVSTALLFLACSSGSSDREYSDDNYQFNNENNYNPSFRGRIGRSCNIQGHDCPGFIPTKHDNMLCWNCANSGYRCHKGLH